MTITDDLAAENRRLRELLARHGIDPAAGDTQAAHYKRLFALQQQARDLGRSIMAGGHGWRGSYYGAVRATCPEGSRIARRDSWRCHHDHPDDLSAEECALGEVRRLAAGGSYEPCSAGPGCQDEFCRRDWAKLTRAPMEARALTMAGMSGEAETCDTCGQPAILRWQNHPGGMRHHACPAHDPALQPCSCCGLTHEERKAKAEAEYGPVRILAGTGAILRLIGKRDEVHPRDALAIAYRDRAAAVASAAGNLKHHGHPSLGIAEYGGEAVGVLDLRPSYATDGIAALDPSLPDDWQPPRSNRGAS